jgi:hypothetical protein
MHALLYISLIELVVKVHNAAMQMVGGAISSCMWQGTPGQSLAAAVGMVREVKA